MAEVLPRTVLSSLRIAPPITVRRYDVRFQVVLVKGPLRTAGRTRESEHAGTRTTWQAVDMIVRCGPYEIDDSSFLAHDAYGDRHGSSLAQRSYSRVSSASGLMAQYVSRNPQLLRIEQDNRPACAQA